MSHQHTPKHLYHYTRVETAIEKILPFFELKMFPLRQMNDPEENLMHEVEPYNYIEDLNYQPSYISRLPIASIIRNETLIASFSIDKNIQENGITENVKGYHLQRMWSHYGGSNKGLCLMINYDKFIAENAKIISDFEIKENKVKYDNLNYRDIPEQLFGRSAESCKIESNTTEDFWNSLKNDNNFIENRLFTKNKDWEGESEYRFLAFKKYPVDIIFSIKDSLEYIVLGVHFSRHYLPSILSLVNKDKIKALGLYNGNYYEKQGRFDYQ